jgi:hypothetical protein
MIDVLSGAYAHGDAPLGEKSLERAESLKIIVENRSGQRRVGFALLEHIEKILRRVGAA